MVDGISRLGVQGEGWPAQPLLAGLMIGHQPVLRQGLVQADAVLQLADALPLRGQQLRKALDRAGGLQQVEEGDGGGGEGDVVCAPTPVHLQVQCLVLQVVQQKLVHLHSVHVGTVKDRVHVAPHLRHLRDVLKEVNGHEHSRGHHSPVGPAKRGVLQLEMPNVHLDEVLFGRKVGLCKGAGPSVDAESGAQLLLHARHVGLQVQDPLQLGLNDFPVIALALLLRFLDLSQAVLELLDAPLVP
mmetsp:Transcript_110189/g.190860  ORF Transcript_110189/g.190860 Transcript_110189/m.190860 type:complete len:243 (+) Transcript_110189:688-1416(+)